MKSSELFVSLFIFFISQFIWSQDQDIQLTKKDSIVVNSWVFGLGFNAVDDAGSEFSNIFNVSDNWNYVPFPSRISIGRNFENGLGLGAVATYNKYKDGKTIDNILNTEDIDYFALDLRVNYDLNKIIGETGFFDPYVGVGLGYTDANNQGRGTYNASVGFRTWISENWGLDFSSTGKWTMNSENSTNHIQHAAGAVYRFGIEKGLSTRGLEKLALLEELEKENQRVQDSIAAADEAERRAKELADRLKREEEAVKLAALEKEKLEKENSKRNLIENEIKELGYVYFDLNSSYLNKKDIALLDKLVEILNNNPTLVISISSHTDARGSDKYNLWLSKRRLNRTLEYLRKKGIQSNRILSKARGEADLANECDDDVYCSEEKHSKNRRSEFSVVQI